ncbi:IclR family transcriptional regulator [Phenylobacterium immobile]|uniref:IclR family transcriptional regulator n=1 Tax=Phenylobacterium immobile TaxID=21 RepID=UPI000AF5E944|nr:IclR family transcriptional regulator [Phenylobacterium immobile]
MATPPARSLLKALELMELAVNRGDRAIDEIAEEAGLPPATAHRLMTTLVQAGYMLREKPGSYLPGARLIELGRSLDERAVLAHLGRPALKVLAKACGQTAHLGVLDGDMVTYLAKEAGGADPLFTREGMQLEAYCSGIGKVLLAQLPAEDLQAYLSGDPFVSLTPHTIIDPQVLKTQLVQVRKEGFALDDREIFETLKCIAAPVRGWGGRIVAALSVSAPIARFDEAFEARARAALTEAASAIQARLAPA